MNESPLISDDWVAIRDFSIFSANKNISSSDDIEVTWNDDKHLINIHYKVRETDNGNNNSNTDQGTDSLKWKHSVLYTVEALIGTHQLLENLIPELNVMLPEMPLQQKGMAFIRIESQIFSIFYLMENISNLLKFYSIVFFLYFRFLGLFTVICCSRKFRIKLNRVFEEHKKYTWRQILFRTIL